MNEHSDHLTPGSGDIHVLFNFDALAQASDFRIDFRIERREALGIGDTKQLDS